MTMTERRTDAAPEPTPITPNPLSQEAPLDDFVEAYRGLLSRGGSVPTLASLESIEPPATPGKSILAGLLGRLPRRRR